VDELSDLLLEEISLDAVLELITTLCRDTLAGAAGVGTSLLANGSVVTRGASDGFVEVIDAFQYETDGPCLQAIREGHPIVVSSMDDESRWPDYTPKAREAGVRSSLSYPLTVRGRTIGALNIYAREPEAFGADDRHEAERFAAQASIVLANAQAYATQERLAVNLQEALKTREIIGEAKGILMERERCSSEEAFDMLRRASQHTNVKLRTIAQQIVDSVEETSSARSPSSK
jgi:GAF domain-containing protein